jgi:hypothetical protein
MVQWHSGQPILAFHIAFGPCQRQLLHMTMPEAFAWVVQWHSGQPMLVFHIASGPFQLQLLHITIRGLFL